MHRLAIVSVSCFTLALGCGTEPTFSPLPPFPSEAQGLRLESAISSSTVALGQSAVLTFRLRNLTSEAMTLGFSGGCQILPYIESVSGTVYPHGGQFVCTAAVTSFTLDPQGERVITKQVYGGRLDPDIYVGVQLPVGRYRSYARLVNNSREIELRSPAVEFEVR